jgi:hypothetical protein
VDKSDYFKQLLMSHHSSHIMFASHHSITTCRHLSDETQGHPAAETVGARGRRVGT